MRLSDTWRYLANVIILDRNLTQLSDADWMRQMGMVFAYRQCAADYDRLHPEEKEDTK